MTSVTAFNDMMEQFLEELVQTFPDEPAMKKYQASFDLLRKANARMVMENFVSSISPYADHVLSKDDAFFLEHSGEIDFLNDLNLKKWWTPKLSQNTKDAVWQYIQMLYIMATMPAPEAMPSADSIMTSMMSGQTDPEALLKSITSSISPDAMKQIEAMAEKCAAEMDPNNLDPAAIMSTVTAMLSGNFEKKS